MYVNISTKLGHYSNKECKKERGRVVAARTVWKIVAPSGEMGRQTERLQQGDAPALMYRLLLLDSLNRTCQV